MTKLITKMVLLTAMATGPLVTAGAAYAQRYHEAPGAATNYRSQADQQTIDEISHNDWSAGK